MPTVLRICAARFFFYSNEGSEPPHIHIEHIDHGGKDLHAVGLPLAFGCSKSIPCGNVIWPRTEFPLRRQEA